MAAKKKTAKKKTGKAKALPKSCMGVQRENMKLKRQLKKLSAATSG